MDGEIFVRDIQPQVYREDYMTENTTQTTNKSLIHDFLMEADRTEKAKTRKADSDFWQQAKHAKYILTCSKLYRENV